MLDSSESETNLGHEHVLLQELATRANDVQLRVSSWQFFLALYIIAGEASDSSPEDE